VGGARRSSVSGARSVEEMGEFWDRQDFTELDSDAPDLEFTVQARAPVESSLLAQVERQALIGTPLFDELWRQRTDDERRVLRLLAAGREVGEDDGSVVKGLVREGYVLRGEGIAVPMFASWIVENA